MNGTVEDPRARRNFADGDLRTARILNASEDAEALAHIIAFHAHQSAEKYLKGLLVVYGEDPPRTHALPTRPGHKPGYTDVPQGWRATQAADPPDGRQYGRRRAGSPFSDSATLALLSCYTLVMGTAFAREASYLRDVGRLSDRDIARATGAGVSTVGAWMRRTREPSGVRAERLAELSAVVERLSRVIDADYIPV